MAPKLWSEEAITNFYDGHTTIVDFVFFIFFSFADLI